MQKLLTFLTLTCGIFHHLSLNACKTDSTYSYVYNDSNQKVLTGKLYNNFSQNFQIQTTSYYLNEQNGKWENNYRILNTPDAEMQLAVSITQDWDVVHQQWLNREKTSYSYLTDLQVKEVLKQSWDSSIKTWKNIVRKSYSYNTQGQQDTVTEYGWNGSVFVNTLQQLYIYNGALKSEALYYIWNNSTNYWDPKNKYVYSYEKGLEKQELIYNWDAVGMIWVNYYKTDKTYNQKSQMLSKSTQYWNNAWTNDGKELYGYNNNGCLTNTNAYFNWQTGDSSWGFHAEEVNFSTGNLAITSLKVSRLSIFPNPAGAQVFILSDERMDYQLYSGTGQQLMHGALISGENVLDLSSFAPGIYFLQTPSGARKLIVR